MQYVTTWSIPLVVVLIVGFGYCKGTPVFEAFLKGAADGLAVSAKVLPALVALIAAVGVFRASGALDMLTLLLAPVARLLALPQEIIPLALLRPISGSGAMVIFNDLLQTHGADSFVGRVASVMEGSTETTFYTIAVYFGAVGIKKSRHAAPAALSADIAGYLLSAYFVRLFFH